MFCKILQKERLWNSCKRYDFCVISQHIHFCKRYDFCVILAVDITRTDFDRNNFNILYFRSFLRFNYQRHNVSMSFESIHVFTKANHKLKTPDLVQTSLSTTTYVLVVVINSIGGTSSDIKKFFHLQCHLHERLG